VAIRAETDRRGVEVEADRTLKGFFESRVDGDFSHTIYLPKPSDEAG
jgi:hypothetical protein